MIFLLCLLVFGPIILACVALLLYVWICWTVLKVAWLLAKSLLELFLPPA